MRDSRPTDGGLWRGSLPWSAAVAPPPAPRTTPQIQTRGSMSAIYITGNQYRNSRHAASGAAENCRKWRRGQVQAAACRRRLPVGEVLRWGGWGGVQGGGEGKEGGCMRCVAATGGHRIIRCLVYARPLRSKPAPLPSPSESQTYSNAQTWREFQLAADSSHLIARRSI